MEEKASSLRACVNHVQVGADGSAQSFCDYGKEMCSALGRPGRQLASLRHRRESVTRLQMFVDCFTFFRKNDLVRHSLRPTSSVDLVCVDGHRPQLQKYGLNQHVWCFRFFPNAARAAAGSCGRRRSESAKQTATTDQESVGCCLMLDPHYSNSSMYLGDEGTYVCKAFSPRSYVIQKFLGVVWMW
ncbi:hypothetical protein OUZ56_024688 [Daphnia magna]|uniref:Uncharacterized protein n=1 Tax=Daphnia magna TaxID=35525 RepID=A0ABR0B1W2_9CRUS|nr:hypothetical protein OUZ56_024688 [Daphnia magna]